MSEIEYPKIGTAVWVCKNGKVLLGVRTKESGYGTWCPPGGHLEMNETILECAIRETREEAGIEIENIRLLNFQENIWKEHGTHFITMYLSADWRSGEPVAQPEEIKDWGWFDWNNLPQPIFRPSQLFIDTGISPFD